MSDRAITAVHSELLSGDLVGIAERNIAKAIEAEVCRLLLSEDEMRRAVNAAMERRRLWPGTAASRGEE